MVRRAWADNGERLKIGLSQMNSQAAGKAWLIRASWLIHGFRATEDRGASPVWRRFRARSTGLRAAPRRASPPAGAHHHRAPLAHAYAVVGRRTEAETMLRDLQRRSSEGYVSPCMIATIYAGL